MLRVLGRIAGLWKLWVLGEKQRPLSNGRFWIGTHACGEGRVREAPLLTKELLAVGGF